MAIHYPKTNNHFTGRNILTCECECESLLRIGSKLPYMIILTRTSIF